MQSHGSELSLASVIFRNYGDPKSPGPSTDEQILTGPGIRIEDSAPWRLIIDQLTWVSRDFIERKPKVANRNLLLDSFDHLRVLEARANGKDSLHESEARKFGPVIWNLIKMRREDMWL